MELCPFSFLDLFIENDIQDSSISFVNQKYVKRECNTVFIVNRKILFPAAAYPLQQIWQYPVLQKLVTNQHG